jgi:erythronate-4-phosphate dehydrogenase
MKIIADVKIPFLRGVFEPYADVVYKNGEDITREDLLLADVLVVRTRTKCDRSLLHGTKVKFIASATIGLDHIDTLYCERNGIKIVNAAGCNAWAVVHYILGAINLCFPWWHFESQPGRVGIIGAGNVGERVASTLELLGVTVLRCDPPVRDKISKGIIPTVQGPSPVSREKLRAEDYYDIYQVCSQSDIVSLHLPLQRDTAGIIDGSLLKSLKRGAMLVNTSRGEILDEQALTGNRNMVGKLVLDVWKDEPQINRELLAMCDIATPHIAGYSLEGKINATAMTVRAVADYLSIEELSGFSVDIPPFTFGLEGEDRYKVLSGLLGSTFLVEELDRRLKDSPGSFERIRSEYHLRREIPPGLYTEIAKIMKHI